MSERTSFYRKIGYAIAIVVLCFLMSWLSRPATTNSEGGKLAQLRTDYNLAQVDIGKIDPASETIKLATLGLRGVAVNLLWEKANYYKKVEDWTNLTATLEQLAKLQPNFITFWKFQAWNLTYNVSVEFDDYNDRYYYVRRGIEFLKEGERYNVDNPVLLWDLGWFIGQKIGRADEYVQYRRLFKADDDFHEPDRTPEDRDNWLVGKEWYLKAIDSVDNKGHSLGRKSPRDFYSSPAKSQINYAEAIEEEGFFDKAQGAWITAGKEWRDFGNTVIEHSTGVKLQLGSQPDLEQEVAELRAELDAMLPEVRERLAAEKRHSLTSEERQLLDKPRDQRTGDEYRRVADIEAALVVSDRDVAMRIAREHPDKEKQALLLANKTDDMELVLQYTKNYKRDANYDYWQTRTDFEQTENALSARELMFRAKKAFEDADLLTAKKLYDEGFAKWRLVIDEFPSILDQDATTGDDLMDFIKRYRDVLDQLDQQLPDDFPLWEVVENFDKEQEFVDELRQRRERLGLPEEDNNAVQLEDVERDGVNSQSSESADGEAGSSDGAGADVKPSDQPEADTSEATDRNSSVETDADASEADDVNTSDSADSDASAGSDESEASVNDEE